ncbi:hypothetical protein SPRG_14052 [Saprolegnia parasitica CBS 223.65]|uniref:Disintegrin domain-containing protein n=1 Tax=Saprolegnia parasitica (strain CBS 223.65) TaxID=695850 RepID=A0A067BVT2_SAPPC|nr:hypothetical protein SPRG_14052 [Saprolegnia parasitica CBS 223.65]KDO20960.1 hypothetical protein SPRG_14052 [Saprolegnia parasitica CBS 223.65]|eukprot:XP_012208350.1 hypothetical protein SPRG_14052 [Saprolegnia parasitica CBS 223.65]
MFRLWRLVWTAAAAAVAADYVIDRMPVCVTIAHCPILPCHDLVACSTTGHCQYTKHTKGTLCPSQGCSNGGFCDDDANDACDADGECVDGFFPSTYVCRWPLGDCDVPELCTGYSGTCPDDALAAFGAPCTGIANGAPCDGQDICDGNGACIDQLEPAGAMCNGDVEANPCIIPGTCCGTTRTCSAPRKARVGTPCTGESQGQVCDAPDTCDGDGRCVDRFEHGTICKIALDYSRAVFCNGRTGACPVSSFMEASDVETTGNEVAKASAETSSNVLVAHSSPSLLVVGVIGVVVGGIAVAAYMRQSNVTPGDYVALSL